MSWILCVFAFGRLLVGVLFPPFHMSSRHFISESLVRSMIAKIRNGQMADRQLLRKYLDEQRTDNIRLPHSSVLTPSFNY